MNELQNRNIDCPYCGESINILIDCSILQQNYIEDCQVCCRPIIIDVKQQNDGEIDIIASHENE